MNSLLFILLIGQISYGVNSPVFLLKDNRHLEISFSPAESSRAVAVMVPVISGQLPEVVNQGNCRISWGRRMKAAGIEVVPLVISADDNMGAVNCELRFKSSVEQLSLQCEMAELLFPWINARWARDAGTAGYLIIVPDEFYNNILPLVQWKEKKGFTVRVAKTSETGSQRDQIRSYIQNAYFNWTPRPLYVLLVGAINKIPAFPTPGATSCVTDHPYSCVDGDDYLSDLFVGRLPAANASELDCIVAKIIRYEVTPNLNDTMWFRRALMVGTSYQEGGTPAVTALVTKRRIREQLLAHGFTVVDTVFYPPTPSGRGPVDSAVNRGVLFVNGRGWGQSTGWNYPQFLINDVYNLNNGDKLPVVTSLYCGTGNFQANPCFGEAWLRAGTPMAPKGGVAFWGASYTGTSTRWNNCMDYGIYHAIFDRGVTTLGPAMYCGKLEQLINFPLPADSADLIIYFHVYNLLGDPGMEMWTGVPKEIAVSHPGVFPVGGGYFAVLVQDRQGNPVQGAKVCLYKPGDLQMVKNTGQSGYAEFVLPSTTTDTIFVTVTGTNLVPYLGYSLGEMRGVFVGHLRHNPDTVFPGATMNLAVTLKNFGVSQTANDVQAVLIAADSWSTVLDSVKDYGALAPGEEVSGMPFAVRVSRCCSSGQILPFYLRVRSGDSLWVSGFNLVVNGPLLKINSYVVYDGNGFLDPGETAEIAVNVFNQGGGRAVGTTGILRSANPWAVIVLDSTGFFGTLMPGDSVVNSGDRFRVRAAPNIGVGRKFLLWVVFTGSDGSTGTDTAGAFEQVAGFSITIGEPVVTAPLGPDRYGYYGYDDADVGYQEQPQFDWIEIDPGYGGRGTRLNIGNDQAIPIDLPWVFRFYGRDYRTISIADNGYIAMGTTRFSDQYNWHIPSAQGPEGLIAVFWDDFHPDTLDASGVFYYHDEENRRFIIQWSRIYHIHGFRRPVIAEEQTFQAILYDPTVHSTKSGDSPILLQYLDVQNDDSLWENGHNYATVGIQSPDHLDGLEWTYAGSYPIPAAEIVSGRAIKFTTNPPDTFTAIGEFGEKSTNNAGFLALPTVARNRVVFKVGGVQNGRLEVFDVLGRQVREFFISGKPEDDKLYWLLDDEKGKKVNPGVYFIRLTGESDKGKILYKKTVKVLP